MTVAGLKTAINSGLHDICDLVMRKPPGYLNEIEDVVLVLASLRAELDKRNLQ